MKKYAEAILQVLLRRFCVLLILFQGVLYKIAVFLDRPQLAEVIWRILIYKVEPVGVSAVGA